MRRRPREVRAYGRGVYGPSPGARRAAFRCDALERALLTAVNAIAAGMRNPLIHLPEDRLDVKMTGVALSIILNFPKDDFATGAQGGSIR
jgi:hypothetical protein